MPYLNERRRDEEQVRWMERYAVRSAFPFDRLPIAIGLAMTVNVDPKG
jgi:hypothetical protein